MRDKFVPAGKHFPEEQNQFDDLSSFSVFDGHGGVKTKFFVSIQMRKLIYFLFSYRKELLQFVNKNCLLLRINLTSIALSSYYPKLLFILLPSVMKILWMPY